MSKTIDLPTTELCPPARPARRHILLMSGIMLALAAAFGAPPAAAASSQSAPVEQLYAALVQVMKAGRATPFQQRYAMLAPTVEAAFNLDEILQSAVGPRWATMQPNEQAALRDAFRRYTIATYLSNFDSYSGQRFDVTPTPRAVGSDQIIETRIIPTSGEQHRLDYVMRPTGAGWKIVDVLADGSISRAAVLRSEFRGLLAGGAPALLDRLQKKIADLSR